MDDLQDVFFRERGHGPYARMTSSIIEAIWEGVSEFRMPWHGPRLRAGFPYNAATGERYDGINAVALWASAKRYAFHSTAWATRAQWKSLGVMIGTADPGTTIAVHGKGVRGSADAVRAAGSRIRHRRAAARCASVFNASQVSGASVPWPVLFDLTDRIARAERLVQATGARIKRDPFEPHYAVPLDAVCMPDREMFTEPTNLTINETYYSTLLHELVHWTGAPHRLGRQLSHAFSAEAHAVEELVAELSTGFLCASLGIGNAPRLDHARYVEGWLRTLDEDGELLLALMQLSRSAIAHLTKSST